MRASVIVGLFMIALLGLGLRHQANRSVHVPARALAQDNPEVRAARQPKNPKTPALPDAGPPKGKVDDGDAEPPKQQPEVRSRDRKPSKPAEPQVLWSKEIVGDARTSSQASRQNALEAGAAALGEFLTQKYPGFKWAATPEFLTENNMIVDEKDEPRQLADPDAPPLFQTKMKFELRDVQLKAALQEDRKVRVESRLWQAGRGLGGLLVVLFTIVGYVRLDDWTKGYLSFPLKLTAITVAVAGPAVIWWLV